MFSQWESLIAIRYEVLTAGGTRESGAKKRFTEEAPPTLTNPMIVFHNNHERAQRATKRFFSLAFLTLAFFYFWKSEKSIRIFKSVEATKERQEEDATEQCVCAFKRNK